MVRQSISKMLYGILFIVIIPVYLWCLSQNIELQLPTYHLPVVGSVLIIFGTLLILSGFSDLFFKGHGLPMNAFPPKNLVKNGVYGLIPHPIYSGFVIVIGGLSLYYGSSTGLWLLMPLALAGCLSLIWGYERPYLLRTFQHLPSPWLGVPSRNGVWWRLGSFFALFIPWLLIFEGFKLIGTPMDAFDIHFDIEKSIPVMIWSYPVYASAYLWVFLPFLFCKIDDLKYFFSVGWLSLVVMSLFYLAIPAIAIPRALPELMADDHSIYRLFYQALHSEMQQASPYTAAFPSYHVVWAVLVAQILSRISAFWKGLAWLWSGLIIISCFTTGMHAFADLVAGLVVGLLLFKAPIIWQAIIRRCNTLANSYHFKLVGYIRIMSHFRYSFAAGFTLILITLLILGASYGGIIIIMACVGLLGAVLWGWLVEGGTVSMRPLGYFGSVLGFLAVSLLLIMAGYHLWLIIAALFCAGTFAQAVGRFRCIVQGCCHGGAIASSQNHQGFCVHAARSRVVTLSNLANQVIYPTQLYSIFGNLVLGIILIRLWFLQVDISLIIGLYLVCTGYLRFVEEAYRGEVQTPHYFGLATYQWLSLLFLLVGSLIMTLNLGYPPLIATFNFSDFIVIGLWAVLGGLIGGFVGSIDFPNSNRPFSRLER